jgi:hypothetical protein
MQVLSRRKFVTASALVAGGAAFGLYHGIRRNLHRGTICLLPVEGVNYTDTFSRFMKRARFDSVRDALASIRDPRTPVRIAHIANDQGGQLPNPRHSMACNTCRPESSQKHRAAGLAVDSQVIGKSQTNGF